MKITAAEFGTRVLSLDIREFETYDFEVLRVDYFKITWSRFTNVTHQEKRDLMGIAKSIDSGQPALSAQADHGPNFLLLADFLCIKILPN